MRLKKERFEDASADANYYFIPVKPQVNEVGAFTLSAV